MKKRQIRQGIWKQRDGDFSLVIGPNSESDEVYRWEGVSSINCIESIESVAWDENGRYWGGEESSLDLIEFITDADWIPEPPIVDSVGTYEADNGFRWVVFTAHKINNDEPLRYRAVRFETAYAVGSDGVMEGSHINLVKKLSDGIEL